MTIIKKQQLTNIAVFLFIMKQLHECHFFYRYSLSEFYAQKISEYLINIGHFKKSEKTEKDEDVKGIDRYVAFKNKSEKIPIQFKIRDKRSDIPISRFQPFWGLNNKKTIVGRDYVSLENKVSKFYYTAKKNNENIFDEVLIIESNKLHEIIKEAEDEMKNEKYNLFSDNEIKKITKSFKKVQKMFTASNGVEAWFQKNINENIAKINLYVPKYYASEVISIDYNFAKSMKTV